MSLRRDRRVARSAFKQHSDPGVYTDPDTGRSCPVSYIPQDELDLVDGEYDEAVIRGDMLDVLVEELPSHNVSKGTLRELETGKVWVLGRELANDGQVRTLEVTPE